MAEGSGDGRGRGIISTRLALSPLRSIPPPLAPPLPAAKSAEGLPSVGLGGGGGGGGVQNGSCSWELGQQTQEGGNQASLGPQSQGSQLPASYVHSLTHTQRRKHTGTSSSKQPPGNRSWSESRPGRACDVSITLHFSHLPCQ